MPMAKNTWCCWCLFMLISVVKPIALHILAFFTHTRFTRWCRITSIFSPCEEHNSPVKLQDCEALGWWKSLGVSCGRLLVEENKYVFMGLKGGNGVGRLEFYPMAQKSVSLPDFYQIPTHFSAGCMFFPPHFPSDTSVAHFDMIIVLGG